MRRWLEKTLVPLANTIKDAPPSRLQILLLRDPDRAKMEAGAAISSPELTAAAKASAWIVFAKASVIMARKADEDDDGGDSGGGWFMWLEARAGFESAKKVDASRTAEADAGIALCNRNIERIEGPDDPKMETRFPEARGGRDGL